jgi:hypothetical protein
MFADKKNTFGCTCTLAYSWFSNVSLNEGDEYDVLGTGESGTRCYLRWCLVGLFSNMSFKDSVCALAAVHINHAAARGLHGLIMSCLPLRYGAAVTSL